MLQLSFYLLIQASSVVSAINAPLQKEETPTWPSEHVGAWEIALAKTVGEQKSDTAARGNLFLIVGKRMYIACDRNEANGRDFSKRPLLIEWGFEAIEVSPNKDGFNAFAKHADGVRELLFRIMDRGAKAQIDVSFVDKPIINYDLLLKLEKINQRIAKQRVKAIIQSGNYSGKPEKQALAKWLSDAIVDDRR